MTIAQEVTQLLETKMSSRERRFHDQFLVDLLKAKYTSGLFFPEDKLLDFAKDFESYNRAWRKVLEDCPHLRGSDYEDKEVLEQEKQIELGYEVGYYKDVSLRTANA